MPRGDLIQYISEKSESDFYECEKAREQWEVTYNPEGEKREMIEIYTGRYGFTTEDAVTFTEIAFKYPVRQERQGHTGVLPQPYDEGGARTWHG
ncbi:MAG: uncharacterized protein KVP18_000325 [Porospora cf. gigantea A]|uniref:uncharacterized protein n=1 Tax=Porospora cf. gigantea A TaxID=2853593 RepID=UPI00355A42F6|nr:MAG: hypothetical protein KVP18_000325 [Porospora cf. gigantea A]